MKKKLWKAGAVFAMLIAFAMVFTACGGGSGSNGAAPAKAADVTGTYHAQYDVKDLLNKEMAEQGISLESAINADFTLELKDDESFVFSIDGEAFADAVVGALKADGPAMVKELLASEGVQEDMYDTLASMSGFDTFDEFLEGMIDQIATEVKESLDSSITDSLEAKGTYTVDGNTLNLTPDSGQVKVQSGTINDDGSITVALSNDDMSMELVFTK